MLRAPSMADQYPTAAMTTRAAHVLVTQAIVSCPRTWRLPAITPEPQKIATPRTMMIARPRKPIFGIRDGLGGPTNRWSLNSSIRLLMLGLQNAENRSARLDSVALGSRP